MVLVSVSFLSRTLFNIISCVILTNNNKEKKIEFLGKPRVNLQKVWFGRLEMFIAKKGFFFLSRILLIIISFLLRLWKMEFKITSPIPFEFDYHFHDISYFVFLARMYWAVLWSRHVMFSMILSRTLCKVRSLKVCCFARLQVSHA